MYIVAEEDAPRILSISQIEDRVELLLQENVFKPENSLITQVLVAKSGFKVQR